MCCSSWAKLWWQLIVLVTAPRPTTSNSEASAAVIIACREPKAYRCAHCMSATYCVELRRALHEVGQVRVRQLDEPLLHQPLGVLDRPLRQLVADPARAGVQHQPDDLPLVEADLDEVVAGAERAELRRAVARCRSVSSVAGEPIAASAGGGADRAVPACALPMPAGMRRSMSGISRRRLSGRSAAVRSVSVAIMPQPMSTPIAYGMMAPAVGMTAPIGGPKPVCASGISATCEGTQASDAARAASSSVLSSTSLPQDSTFLRTIVGTSHLS
jgi:hypothetical protein